MMLKLVDLIRLSGVELGDYKIHCATDNQRGEWRPLEQYRDGSFEAGQARQNQKNFECESVLSLISLDNRDQWLFVGIYHVNGVQKIREQGWSGYYYDLTCLPGLEHLVGRAIVDFRKEFRACYLVGKHFEERLIVSWIRESKRSIAPFPGFNSVRVSFPLLKSIVRESDPSWQTALANVAGVYVISDASSGKHYVGSAYGGVGLWQRWSAYATTGHGGNKELRDLLRAKGIRHADNFQFAVVEICDINAGHDYVIDRETHWKEVFMSRDFGFNRN